MLLSPLKEANGMSPGVERQGRGGDGGNGENGTFTGETEERRPAADIFNEDRALLADMHETARVLKREVCRRQNRFPPFVSAPLFLL
jgi:hypothetical protein